MNYIIDSVIFSLGETNSHKYSVVEIDIDCVQLRAGWCGKWQAKFKRKYIGLFTTVEEAAEAIRKYREESEDER